LPSIRIPGTSMGRDFLQHRVRPPGRQPAAGVRFSDLGQEHLGSGSGSRRGGGVLLECFFTSALAPFWISSDRPRRWQQDRDTRNLARNVLTGSWGRHNNSVWASEPGPDDRFVATCPSPAGFLVRRDVVRTVLPGCHPHQVSQFFKFMEGSLPYPQGEPPSGCTCKDTR
jgi:hypothetical protein